MRKKEQLLWDAMKANCPSALWLQRIENLVGAGLPDVYVGRSGKWVELKAPSRKARESTPLLGNEGLNTDQVNWHLKHSMMNAPESYILIRTAEKELLLVPGRVAPIINSLPLDKMREVSCAVPTWEGIAKELK